MASTNTIKKIIDWLRVNPQLTNVLGNPAAGYASEPALSIANAVVQEVLAPDFDWKWNRGIAAPFYLNSLQQDYPTTITDLGYLESATSTDINSTANPKPIRGIEVVRDLLPTSMAGKVSQVCWIYNYEAQLGTWKANQTYVNGVSLGHMASQPFTAIKDSNGNIQILTTYGTTGNVQPTWSTTIGATTTDGSAVWTMADPNGICFRIAPLPPDQSTLFQIAPIYQKKPPSITALTQTWSPIPDELAYVYRQGMLALALRAADNDRWEKEYLVFQNMIQKALNAGDREEESFSMYPATPLMDGGGNPGPFWWGA
jgi:hypothetical protein